MRIMNVSFKSKNNHRIFDTLPVFPVKFRKPGRNLLKKPVISTSKKETKWINWNAFCCFHFNSNDQTNHINTIRLLTEMDPQKESEKNAWIHSKNKSWKQTVNWWCCGRSPERSRWPTLTLISNCLSFFCLFQSNESKNAPEFVDNSTQTVYHR